MSISPDRGHGPYMLLTGTIQIAGHCDVLRERFTHLLTATVSASGETAHGQSASGLKPRELNTLMN